jgi:hypothetical protein
MKIDATENALGLVHLLQAQINVGHTVLCVVKSGPAQQGFVLFSCSIPAASATADLSSSRVPPQPWRSAPPGRTASCAPSSAASTPPRSPWRGRSSTSSRSPAPTWAAGSPRRNPGRRGLGWSGCGRGTRATCGSCGGSTPTRCSSWRPSGSARPRRAPRQHASPTRSARLPRPPPRRRARPSGVRSSRTSARPL